MFRGLGGLGASGSENQEEERESLSEGGGGLQVTRLARELGRFF